ncbi:MAG: MoxR family ATPase [Pseudomonadota bacterium]
MSLNASIVSAGDALDVLRTGWAAQSSGQMQASWMLHGRPGVGKTELVQSLAHEIGARLFDLRLTTIEPQDLRGLPYYDHDQKRTVWYRPADLPDDPTQPSVLFLDELTAASPYLQPTVYGLLQERRVGQHRLPDNVLIIAAGNTVEDGAVAYEMGTALSDRLIHLHVQANAKDWLEHYAVRAALHPAVTAFIRTRPDLLETTEDALRRGETIACTPRSWARVSQIMHAVPDRRLRNVMVAGTVGQAAAHEFTLIADEIAATVQVDEMLQTPRAKRGDLYPKTLHGLVAMIYGLVAQASADTTEPTIDILADMSYLGSDHASLPLADLTSFGFEILIRKALDNGWEDAFARSKSYADYAKAREDAGLV